MIQQQDLVSTRRALLEELGIKAGQRGLSRGSKNVPEA